MLVLTRKVGDSILIGDDIEITILSIKNDQIKVGIKAPRHLDILRKELLVQIRDENQQAANVQGDLLRILKSK